LFDAVTGWLMNQTKTARTRALCHVCVLMRFDQMEKLFERPLRETFRAYSRVTAVLGL